MKTADLVNCTDAREWAKEFVRTREAVTKEETVESMECWFATALLAGQREAQKEAAELALDAIGYLDRGFNHKALFSLQRIVRPFQRPTFK